jgi:hypothetical protein
MVQPTPAQRMEHVIRTFIQACNDADAVAIAARFRPEAVQYAPGIKWSGAATIGTNFAQIVRDQEYCWTVDKCSLMATAARLHWNGRRLTENMPGSCAEWIGSSASRRHWVFKRSVSTQ